MLLERVGRNRAGPAASTLVLTALLSSLGLALAELALAGPERIRIVVTDPPPVRVQLVPGETEPAAPKPSLTVMGGTDARTVGLRLADPTRLPAAELSSSDLLRAQEKRFLYGRLQLIVRNGGNQDARVAVRYWRTSATGDVVMPGQSDLVELLGEEPAQREGNAETTGTEVGGDASPSESAPVVEAGSERELRFVFAVPADDSPSRLDGTLSIEGTGGDGPHPDQRVDIPLKGVAQAMSGVAFAPKNAVIQVDRLRWCVLDLCDGDDAATEQIRLVGPGAREALRDLRLAHPGAIPVILRRDGQDSHEAWLKNLEVDEGDPQAVVGVLDWADDPAVGKWEGSLQVSQFAAEAPALPVELRSRLWFLIPFLLIFAGVMLAQQLLQRYALQRRRSRIQRALDDTVHEYCCAHRHEDSKLVWNLSGVVTCDGKWDPRWASYDDLDTSGRILAALHWARNDEDLDEVEAATLALLVRVKSWLLILTCLPSLKELGDERQTGGTARPGGVSQAPERKPIDRAGHPWEGTRVALDTALVFAAAKREPADAKAARGLEERIRLQLAWQNAFVTAWELYARLERDPDNKAELAEVKLDELDRDATPVATRTWEEQSELLFKLDVAYRRLLALAKKGPALREVDMPSEIPRPRANPGAGALAAQLEVLERHAARPQMAFATMKQVGESPMWWSAPAASEPEARRLAVGDAPGETAAAEEQAGRAQHEEHRRTQRLTEGLRSWTERGNPVEWLNRRRWGDVAMTALILALSSVAYALTLYHDTWGSWVDIASALLAGVAGRIAITWGALPLYRSVRMRAKGAAAT